MQHQLSFRSVKILCSVFSDQKKKKNHIIQDTTVHKSTFKNIGRRSCGRFYKEDVSAYLTK